MLYHYHIYAKAKCPYCVKAINLLHEMGYEFVLTLVDNSPEYYHKLKQKYEHPTVPMIVERSVAGDEWFIGGWSDLEKHFADYLNDDSDTEVSPNIPV